MEYLRSRFVNEIGDIACFENGRIYDGGSSFNTTIGWYESNGNVRLLSDKYGGTLADIYVTNGEIRDRGAFNCLVGYCKNGTVYDARGLCNIVAHYTGDDADAAAAAAYVAIFSKLYSSDVTDKKVESSSGNVSSGGKSLGMSNDLKPWMYIFIIIPYILLAWLSYSILKNALNEYLTSGKIGDTQKFLLITIGLFVVPSIIGILATKARFLFVGFILASVMVLILSISGGLLFPIIFVLFEIMILAFPVVVVAILFFLVWGIKKIFGIEVSPI